MLRKIFIAFLILVFLFFLVLFSLPLWIKKALPVIINHALKDIRIESLDYHGENFRWPSDWALSGLSLDFKKDGVFYKCRIALLKISRELPQSVSVNLSGFKIESPLFKAEGILAAGDVGFHDGRIRGSLHGDSFSAAGYKLGTFRATIEGDGRNISLRGFSADCYGGKITGEISLEYAPRISYSIDIKLTDVDPDLMKAANPAVFSQVQGKINGTAFLAGNLKEIDRLEGRFDIAEGGKLKAALLGFLVPYIPQSTQKKELELLVKGNGDIPFENGALRLKNLDKDTLSTQIDLQSKAFNLDFDVGVDVHVDGGLNKLLDYSKVLVK